MLDINFLAVAVATIGAFIISGIWYAILGDKMAALQKTKTESANAMGPAQIAIELARSAVVAVVLAYILRQLGSETWLSGVKYGMLLWIAFPVVLLVGSVVHEKVHLTLAAIHAGDWLVKLIFVATLLSVWR